MSENVEWVNLASVEEIPQPGAIKVDVDDLIICLAKDSNGVIHALDDTCSHAAVSLSEGEVEDDGIECWLHGSRFDLLTGRPSHLPATVPVAVHTVRVTDDGDVLVALAG